MEGGRMGEAGGLLSQGMEGAALGGGVDEAEETLARGGVLVVEDGGDGAEGVVGGEGRLAEGLPGTALEGNGGFGDVLHLAALAGVDNEDEATDGVQQLAPQFADELEIIYHQSAKKSSLITTRDEVVSTLIKSLTKIVENKTR